MFLFDQALRTSYGRYIPAYVYSLLHYFGTFTRHTLVCTIIPSRHVIEKGADSISDMTTTTTHKRINDYVVKRNMSYVNHKLH